MITFSANASSREKGRVRKGRSSFDVLLRLCEQIIEFMAEHHLDGCKAYIAQGNGAPELFLVTQKEAYDFDLADKLSDFAAPYIARSLLGSVALIPASSPDELTAYLDVSKAIQIERGH